MVIVESKALWVSGDRSRCLKLWMMVVEIRKVIRQMTLVGIDIDNDIEIVMAPFYAVPTDAQNVNGPTPSRSINLRAKAKDFSPSAAERIGCVVQRTKVFRLISCGLKHGVDMRGII